MTLLEFYSETSLKLSTTFTHGVIDEH